MVRTLLSVPLIAMLAACAGEEARSAASPEPTRTTLLEAEMETSVLAPDSSMRLVSGGDGEVLLSAGFFNRREMARINLPSRASWAPDSRRLFINDSGSAAWSTFRLFEVTSNGVGTERPEIRRSAVAELGRRNGCADVPDADATTWGLAWADGGRQVYVLAMGRRETGDCRWSTVGSLLVIASTKDGRVIEAVPEDQARARFPSLPWDGPL